jgi:hypothetical protein
LSGDNHGIQQISQNVEGRFDSRTIKARQTGGKEAKLATKIRESPMETEGCTTPGRKRFRLKSARDTTGLLQQVINHVWNDELATDKARVIIYAASTLVKAFEVTELEGRLRALEERIGK